MKLLVTRAAADAAHTGEALAARGHEAVLAPLIEIRPIQAEFPRGRVQAVLATSANAVRAIAGREGSRDLVARPLLAVGDHTGEAAREAGFRSVFSARGDGEDLIELVKTRLSTAGGPLLHLSGRHLAVDLAARLEPAGFEVHRTIVYEARPAASLPAAARQAIAGNQLDGVLLYSPRTARILLDLVRRAGLLTRLASIRIYCLSDSVAAPLSAAGLRQLATAERPEESALLDTLDRR